MKCTGFASVLFDDASSGTVDLDVEYQHCIGKFTVWVVVGECPINGGSDLDVG